MKKLISCATLAVLGLAVSSAAGAAVASGAASAAGVASGAGSSALDNAIDNGRLKAPERTIEARDLVVPERVKKLQEAVDMRTGGGELTAKSLRDLARSEAAFQVDPARGGEVSAATSITVLAANRDINAVANAFGLTAVYEDRNTGLAVFEIGEHADVVSLLREMRASDLVSAARKSRTELGYELDVMRR